MRLRTEIEPRIDIAKEHYQTILDYVTGYESYVDEKGDENNEEYKRIEAKIQDITGKDMSRYNLWETWEAEGPEVLSFRISLPDPNKIKDLTREELLEIIRRTRDFDVSKIDNDSFESNFIYYLDDYYHSFLKLNCKNYNYNYFIRQKDGSTLTNDEIVNKLT